MIKSIEIAGDFWTKFKGLMFRDSLEVDEAMLFLNCSRIHTCFMKFDLCVIYLDEHFNIIGHEILKPWKIGSKIKGAKHIIEASSEIKPYIGCMTRVIIKMEEVHNG